jgi:hypothetical protein
MGWTAGDGGRTKVTAEQMKPWVTVSGKTITPLKHHRHGEEDWFLYEVRDASGAVEKAIQVTIWDGDYHKEMGAECHPYYYGCPVSWLKEVAEPRPEQTDYREWWRRVKGEPATLAA